MRKWIGVLMASLLLASAVQGFAQQAAPFADVPANHWAAKAIADLAQAGIIEGVGVGPTARYEGSRPITRYEVAMALARMLRLIEEVKQPVQQLTIQDIKNLIMNDAEVQRMLRGPQGERGPQGPVGPVGPPGTPGTGGTAVAPQFTPQEVNQIRQLLANPTTAVTGQFNAQEVQAIRAKLLTDTLKPQFTVEETAKLKALIGNANQPPAALTPAQIANLIKLLDTFGPEIATIRGDVRALGERVTAVENAVAKIPPLRVDVAGGARFGLFGTELSLRDNADNDADLAAIYGSAANGSETRKDALKGGRFGVYRTDINLNGTITDNLVGHATLRAISPVVVDATPFAAPTAPTIIDPFTGGFPLGITENVQLWDWYATFNTSLFGRNAALTAGRFTSSIGEGLLVDTNAQPLLGVALDSGIEPITYGFNLALLDRYTYAPDPTVPQDFFAYGYLGWTFKDWNMVATLMPRGFAGERGWSIAAEGNLCGKRVFGEFAHLLPEGDFFGSLFDISRSNVAAVVGADLLNDWNGLSLTARLGKIGVDYDPTLSLLNPYADYNAYDISFVDRPLFLSQAFISDGWETDFRYVFGKDYLARLRVYGKLGDLNNPAAGDLAMTISLKKAIANGVSANILYGWRDLDAPAGVDDLQVLRAGVEFIL